ncbi:TPA: nucleotidyl transferase AbiEii/AbiGii toxin family protein, partial [Aeromonas salmonicida subsp. salmonicida]|nr:nucleotidyl transferase AbiEii/AbiGii toxin family protein [Aeromonas salmonicida subsp. salmonicida]ELM3711808.1 nucleotidyl transferase AbiEii/AbiGii toxin family protein [Aeromonas salmonicida subsp. salmonicida]
MQPKDSSIFADVSDYFGIDNPAIAEKDYYVVQLLKLLASHSCQHHTMVFAGGTALAKADVKLQRMSEDVDIKLSVNDSAKDESRSAMKRHRKAIRDGLIEELNATGVF